MTFASASHAQCAADAAPRSQRCAVGRPAASAGLSAAVAAVPAAICLATLPPGLAVPFAAVAMVTLVLPAMVLCGIGSLERLACGAAVVCVAGVMMLGATVGGNVPPGVWLRCFAVAACYACTLGAVAVTLDRLRLPAVGAAAMTTLLAMAWLTWPAWLSPWLSGPDRERTAAALVAAHPLFTINGAMREQFPTPWLQHGLAYRHTNLGDDIPYRLPASIAACTGVHAGIAATLLGAAWAAGQCAGFRRQARVGPAPA